MYHTYSDMWSWFGDLIWRTVPKPLMMDLEWWERTWTLILIANFFRSPDLMHWFWQWFVPFTLSGHTDFDYWFLRLKWGSRRVLFVNRRILLALGTRSHLWYVRGYVSAHLFLWLIIPTYVSRPSDNWSLSICPCLPQHTSDNWSLSICPYVPQHTSDNWSLSICPYLPQHTSDN
jgi:hypothetical protein